METNHKELFDQVIGETNETEIPVAEGEMPEEDAIEEKIKQGCIKLDSCTGAGFFIDPANNPDLFSPENVLKHITHFAEQEAALINIQHNLLCHSQVPMHEFSEYLDGLIPRLEASLKGYGMSVDLYKEQNANISSYELALYITFDLFSFTKTILHYLESMAIMAIPAAPTAPMTSGFTNDGVFNPGDVELPDGSGNKCYKVYGHIQADNSVAIIQVNEDSIDPSDMLIVHDEDGDEMDCVISVHTVAKNEEDAARDAKIVFEGYVRDMLETEADKAYRIAGEMQATSGLLG